MKFVIKYSGGDMFAECDGRKEVYFLKDIIYKNYKDTVFKTHKNFNLRAKMFSMPLNNNDTLLTMSIDTYPHDHRIDPHQTIRESSHPNNQSYYRSPTDY